MFTAQDIIIIGEWLQKNFVGDFHIDFVKGFDDIYVLVSHSDGQTRIAYKLTNILRGEN